MAWNACIPQTADFYSYRANALHREESKRNRDGAHRMALCFTHEAMLFSTQNIHLEKSLRYLISFSFHTISKGNHLPIHIQKLMQQVHLHSHTHLRYKLVWLFQMALPEPLKLSGLDCQEQYTQEILYLFLLLEVKLHFPQARKVFQ